MKYLTIITITFLLTGCIGNIYNIPFITTEETTRLEFGMSKTQILENIGSPLYVSKGDNDKVEWVYEVRVNEVQSDFDIDGTIIPNKDHKNKLPGKPIHHLKLIFSKDKLSSWGPFNE